MLTDRLLISALVWVSIGGQVQVGEDDLALPDQVVLGGQGLLDMHDHVGRIEDRLGRVDQLGPGLDVGLVGKAAAGTGHFLHQHRVAVVDHHLDARRGHAHPVLLRLDLFEYSDFHLFLPCMLLSPFACKIIQLIDLLLIFKKP
jgi:hypothetical protein